MLVYLLLGCHSPKHADEVPVGGFERHAELVAVLCQELGPSEQAGLFLVSCSNYALLEFRGAEGSVHRLDVVGAFLSWLQKRLQ